MKKYITIAALLLLAVGCEKGEGTSVVNPDEIRFETSIATRVAGTAFEEGDTFGLYAVEYDGDVVADLQVGGNYLNNEAVTLTSGIWKPARTLYWSANPCDFYAVYPYQPDVKSIDTYIFDIATDQSAPESEGALSGYEAADLLWAKAKKHSREDGAVNLQFKHMMSKVVVKLVKGEKYEGELPEDIVTHIYNTVTTAKADFTQGSLERYEFGEKRTITMRQTAPDTFEAIVVPQHIERRTPLVEITMEGIAYLLNYSVSFRPGYQHTITVTLNTSPDQEKIEIELEGDVGDWN